MKVAEAPPGNARNLSLCGHSDVHETAELHLRHFPHGTEKMTRRQYSPLSSSKSRLVLPFVRTTYSFKLICSARRPTALQSRQTARCCTVWTRSLSLYNGHDNEVRELHLWNVNGLLHSMHCPYLSLCLFGFFLINSKVFKRLKSIQKIKKF